MLPFLILALTTTAVAGKKERAAMRATLASDANPASSAAEIPELAKLLAKAGWTPTPEMSGMFQPGVVFTDNGVAHTLLTSSCFDVTPRTGTYTATEVITQLQAGVSIGATGLGRVATGGELLKRVKFGAPSHSAVERLGLSPKPDCAAQLATLPPETVSASYVVQEVLSAEIAEQTCGRVDAQGRFIGLGEAEAEMARACSVSSLEPVAVGYRTVPLAELLKTPAAVATPAPRPPIASTAPSLSVTCDFAEGWAVAIPADKYDPAEVSMQTLIGLREEPSFWAEYAGDLFAFPAHRCGATPVELPVVGGDYYLLIGQAGTFSARGEYRDNGRVERISIDKPLARSISWRDLNMTWLCISCPYVYVWTGDRFEFRTEIIVDQIGVRAERPQVRSLGEVPVINGRVRLRISEEEDEISHVDALELLIAGHRVSSPLELLAEDDGTYLSMEKGDAHDLVFAVDLPDGLYSAEVMADGYYIPLAGLR